MSKKSFEEQYPGYALIPSKEPKWKKPLVMIGSLAALGLLAAALYGTLDTLGKVQPPLSNMSGVNANTVSTLKNLALIQVRNGDLKSAAKNFEDYFKLGGNDPEAKRAHEEVKNRLNQ